MQRLAMAVLTAAKLRKKSYDKGAERKLLMLEDAGHIDCDFNSCYKMTLIQACDQSAEEHGFDKRGTQPIYLLLKHSWNDSLEWATNYFKEEK